MKYRRISRLVKEIEAKYITSLRTWRQTKSQRDQTPVDIYKNLLEVTGYDTDQISQLTQKSLS